MQVDLIREFCKFHERAALNGYSFEQTMCLDQNANAFLHGELKLDSLLNLCKIQIANRNQQQNKLTHYFTHYYNQIVSDVQTLKLILHGTNPETEALTVKDWAHLSTIQKQKYNELVQY